ncbi:hypothetical protein P154DRAFT_426153, partial [Amniculicola lignicola CBS 123094]
QIIAGLPDAETAGNIVTFVFSMTLVLNGVMQPPNALPGFWIFMYHVSPLTYWVAGVAGVADVGLGGKPVNCTSNELAIFNPPSGQSCPAYIFSYATAAGGNLFNPEATTQCQYCPVSNSDQFLSFVAISYLHGWRNFGLVWAYICFRNFMAVVFYYRL